MRRPGDLSRPLRRERSSTLAVGWSNTSGTWPSERGRRLERTVRRSRARSRLWQRTMPSWLLKGTLPSNSAIGPCARQCARSSTAIVHILPWRCRRTFPAHVEARIADVCDFFREQFNEGARRVEQHAREHCEMFTAALREEAHRELISVEDPVPLAKQVFRRSWCELDTARSTLPGCGR